ncbi:YdbH domain-containing protein [Pelagicoccus sp. NFK12]|uniref:YdbH domain-containing protein n=1 Tax=Pelagicoccus enzymogenes TaxID=2773457 RepID=A0A927FCN5_9BACT|nr:YdbH domain-containing protein [Pelagicoccus enzymogenes]MBD5781954.1 YdbH domain-containing protein [Pelagicoccus enzymogenes]
MNPRLRKLSRILLRSLAALFLILLLGALAAWGLRARIATALAKDYLQEQGIEEPQFTISQLQTDSLTIESIALRHPQATLAADRLQLTFTLSELLNSYRIGSATLQNLTLSLDASQLPADNSQPAPEPLSLEKVFQLLDPSPFLPLPFDRIQIADSTLNLKTPEETLTFPFEIEAAADSADSLQIATTLQHASHTLELEATLADPARTRLQAHLQVDAPVAFLDRYLPHWKSDLPDLHQLSLSSLELQATLSKPLDSPAQLEATLRLHSLAANYEEATASFPLLTLETLFFDFNEIPLHITATPQSILRDTLAVLPEQTLDLDITLSNLNVFEIQTRSPISWTYDSGYLSAASNFQLSYQLENTLRPLQGQIETLRLQLDDQELAPFSLTASGTTDQLNFQTSPLSLANASPATLEGVTGTLNIPEAPAEPIVLALTGTLHPAPLALNGEEAFLPQAALQLESLIFETGTETKLSLASLQSDPLTQLPGIARLAGDLKLDLFLEQPSDSDLASGNVKLDASNISIQSEQLNGDGIAIQSELSFQQWDTNELSNIDLTNEAALYSLLRRTQASLDWQANKLSSPPFSAQWSGGSLALAPQDEQLKISTSFGAGILRYDKLRLDQVYIENEHRGTLAQLGGTASFSAMLEGVTLQADSQHQIDSPLSELSLSGNYTLSPFQLVHSDLPARFLPELAGLSLSAALQAEGDFQANAQDADASLSLTLRDGAIAYPASQVNARGLELDLHLASLAQLDSGPLSSRLRIEDIEAGDLKSLQAESQFSFQNGTQLAVDFATVSLFGGQAQLRSAQIPIDGSDFQSTLDLENFDLDQIARYIDFFDGRMQGKVSGHLPFRLRDGAFELLRGDLRLPDGAPASLRYNTQGLLTQDANAMPGTKPTLSDRILKFLKINPEKTAEQAIGNITITEFYADLFPENEPETPIKIRIGGTAHTDLGDVPVVINTQLHGSLTELYNFVIRLNSL